MSLPDQEVTPHLTQPWSAAVSETNGNLYVTYWGRQGDEDPNGGIAEFETCRNTFLRVVVDDATRGTPPGSDGASGAAAPGGPLTRDPATGLTPGAGGGGGGGFGIAACQAAGGLLFTNDGLGFIGVLDSRIDQVVSAPPISIVACPKPRGTACVLLGAKHAAYVACGQPDSSVLVVSIPTLPENIGGLPVIASVLLVDNQLRVSGSEFAKGTTVELILDGVCVSFKKNAKIKKGGTLALQKGKLEDGLGLNEALGGASSRLIRVVSPDGEVRVARCCAVQ